MLKVSVSMTISWLSDDAIVCYEMDPRRVKDDQDPSQNRFFIAQQYRLLRR